MKGKRFSKKRKNISREMKPCTHNAKKTIVVSEISYCRL